MSWQNKFPETTPCCLCTGEARIGFVAHEAIAKNDQPIVPRSHKQYVCDLYMNTGGEGGDYWLHDRCAVAVYFCRKCLNPTALYNQG